MAVCRGGTVTDGPYAEGKEIVGGWSFIEAESMAQAIEIAKEVPMFPSVEILEIATFFDMTAPELPEHWFRRELGRLVSILSRRFGVHRMELCEDAAQTALLQATQSWSSKLPDDPGAWLYRVAHNHVLDELRREKRDDRYLAEVQLEYAQQEVQDDVLRLLFVCADPAIPAESQLVLSLKTLCGFSIEEISLRLFQSVDAVNKRLQRARARLREHAELQSIDPERVPSVLHMLYLLFNEGYSSARPDSVIRRELCDEALRLALMLKEDPAGALPETDALLALMCFHAARFDARVDGMGGLLAARGAGSLALGSASSFSAGSPISRTPRAERRCRVITSRRGSPRSTVSRPPMRRRTGRRSFGSMSCSNASPPRRSTS